MSCTTTTTTTTVMTIIGDSDIKKEEQERLDEILLICTEYEKQNQTPTNLIGSSSPIVQNRIKTNGSLPREKKTNLSSPTNGGGYNYEYDKRRGSEYENLGGDRRFMNLPLGDSPNGFENIKRAVPQSPRTRIRTCISSPKREEPLFSPTKDKLTDFDRLSRRDRSRKSSSDSDSVEVSPTRSMEPLKSPKIVSEELKKQVESPRPNKKPQVPPKPDNLVKLAGSPRFQKQTSSDSDNSNGQAYQQDSKSSDLSGEIVAVYSQQDPLKLPSSVASEYNAIIKSFEDKLKLEIQLLHEKKPDETASPEVRKLQVFPYFCPSRCFVRRDIKFWDV